MVKFKKKNIKESYLFFWIFLLKKNQSLLGHNGAGKTTIVFIYIILYFLISKNLLYKYLKKLFKDKFIDWYDITW